MAKSLMVISAEDGKEEGGRGSCYVAATERSEMLKGLSHFCAVFWISGKNDVMDKKNFSFFV